MLSVYRRSKTNKKIAVLLSTAALLALSSCSQNVSVVQENEPEETSARSVQTWSLWDGLDYHNTGVFGKADWTNCGWKSDHIWFNNGKMTIKLDNTPSYGKPYSSGEYRTHNKGYHKYAIEYGNGYINWYIDGKWVYGVNNRGFNAPYGKKMPSHPMQIMVNLWPGTGVDSWLKHFWYSGPKYAYYDYINIHNSGEHLIIVL